MLEKFSCRVLPHKSSVDIQKKVNVIHQRKNKQYFIDGYSGFSSEELPIVS